MRQIIAALFLVLSSLPAYADFPRQGIPDIPNGIAEPFVGQWSVGFPQGEGVIFSAELVSCDAPVILTADKDGTLEYTSPSGPTSIFELLAFEGRTSWIPLTAQSSIAVWLSSDSFYLYEVDITGRADWDNPRLYERCN